MIHATSFRDERGKYYHREEVEERDGVWSTKDGTRLETRREKMSKSKYNVISPEDMCREFGADSLRLYELFMGPLEDGGDWETGGVAGCRRFLDRVWRLVTDPDKLTEKAVDAPKVERALHLAIKKVTESADSLRFNTAISDMMVFVNEATKTPQLSKRWLDAFVRILAPFAPHIGEELWSLLGHVDSVTHAPFPNYDAEKIMTATIRLAVQVNGKLRGTIEVDPGAPESDVLAAALAEENVKSYLDGKTLRREIYVPGRIVNLVVG